MQWRGPYPILERVNEVDYRLEIKGKPRTFHINMLKLYYERNNITCNINCAVIDDAESDDCDLNNFLNLSSSENISNVNVNPELDDEKQVAINDLLQEYSVIFSDTPGLTNLCHHEIRLTSDVPIRIKDRFLPFGMKDAVIDEVQKMLSNNNFV